MAITDEQRDTIRGCIELCEKFGMKPTLDRLEGFTGLRLTQEMVDEAQREPEAPEPEPEWRPRRTVIDGVAVKEAHVIPAPPNTPGRLEGYLWIPGLKHGDSVWHEKWHRLKFLRYDGGDAVCEHTKEHLSPDAPPDYPRMGAIPVGGRYTAPLSELWVEDN